MDNPVADDDELTFETAASTADGDDGAAAAAAVPTMMMPAFIRRAVNSRTGTNACTYCSLWGATVQNLFLWVFFYMFMVAGKQTVFSPPGPLYQSHIKVS